MKSQEKVESSRESPAYSPDPHPIRHTRLGAWDVYEQRGVSAGRKGNGMVASALESLRTMAECAPYVWKMFQDIFALSGCRRPLMLYGITSLAAALIPAITLWYHGQLLRIMQTVLDTRTLDKDSLLHICIGRIGCAVVNFILVRYRAYTYAGVDVQLQKWHARRLFRARARLDVPTYESASVQAELSAVGANQYSTPPVSTLSRITMLVTTAVQVCTQVTVLARVLKTQRGGLLYAALTLAWQTFNGLMDMGFFSRSCNLWIATVRDRDYRRYHGWTHVVKDKAHRKELVANDLVDYALSEYERASDRLGDPDRDFIQWQTMGPKTMRERLLSLLRHIMTELPQVTFTVQSMIYGPTSMPLSLATSHIVQSTTSMFTTNVWNLLASSQSLSGEFKLVRRLYLVTEIPNQIVDGRVPFPEDAAQVAYGFKLEFRDVSFKYPEAREYALRNVSFTVLPGQLCVIVGANGSGKSTILKLVLRLYDPEDGQILFNGHDIKTLRLKDLRQAISVLFQDYTHFPLSIRDNIAIGDPSAVDNDEHVRAAARLGGAEALIDKLPDGLDTYLEPPVHDQYSQHVLLGFMHNINTGSETTEGAYDALRRASGIKKTQTSELSGGQMQRLALARTFMRSVVSEEGKVGLLLFDEPSASLDPVAEHELFERLRKLRGNKTMLFSSHRFGNMMRQADLIMRVHIDESTVVAQGTHEVLLKQQGEYAKMWTLQAQAFL
ncbi:HlyB/MsbA family ABC transporter [Trametes maxima]|nr:HlyB/MsbA family ABC transporter [Trametes maxima]